MKRNTRILIDLLMAGLLTAAPLAQAVETEMYGNTAGHKPAAGEPESYGDTVGRKLTSSLANISLSVLELPKNIIIANNQSNVVYGLAGGTMKGVIQTMGRVSVGILDLVTAPLPTKPIVHPLYVWEDFDTQTTYGPIFRLQNSEE